MKKIVAGLFCAGLLLIGSASAWASQECYILSGGDDFGGDMVVNLNIEPLVEAPPGVESFWTANGQGRDSKGDSVILHGSERACLAQTKDVSLRGSGSRMEEDGYGGLILVSIFYEYHLHLTPREGAWSGSFGGEVYDSRGAEKNVSGSATQTSCP